MGSHQNTDSRRRLRWLITTLFLVAAPGTAAGEGPLPDAMARSVIEDRALSGVQGAIKVNQTAGHANAQANSGAIAIGATGPARSTIHQRTASPRTDDGPARARIGANAFRGASGWIAVNQSAGRANAQSNVLAISIGIDGEQLGESDLATVDTAQRTRPGSEGGGADSAAAEIDPSAFAGASGVIQVNQAAGSGNATSNRFGMHVDRAIEP
jgi:hypothetical protein